MKISLGFIKIHQAVYEISALTFLSQATLIFILKNKKVLKIITSLATLTNKICNLMVLGQGVHIFTHNGEKKTKKIPLIND